MGAIRSFSSSSSSSSTSVHLKSVLLSLYTHSMYIDRHATPQNCAHSPRSYFLLNSFHLSLTQ